jgi:hypothetical protein
MQACAIFQIARGAAPRQALGPTEPSPQRCSHNRFDLPTPVKTLVLAVKTLALGGLFGDRRERSLVLLFGDTYFVNKSSMFGLCVSHFYGTPVRLLLSLLHLTPDYASQAFTTFEFTTDSHNNWISSISPRTLADTMRLAPDPLVPERWQQPPRFFRLRYCRQHITLTNSGSRWRSCEHPKVLDCRCLLACPASPLLWLMSPCCALRG